MFSRPISDSRLSVCTQKSKGQVGGLEPTRRLRLLSPVDRPKLAMERQPYRRVLGFCISLGGVAEPVGCGKHRREINPGCYWLDPSNL